MPTTQDILDAIGTFSNDVEKRFVKIESQMVTKDYLDNKLADLKADLIYIDKKTDYKIDVIVGKLHKKKIFTKTESDEIISMSPFPKLG